jgi:hypothetical protein
MPGHIRHGTEVPVPGAIEREPCQPSPAAPRSSLEPVSKDIKSKADSGWCLDGELAVEVENQDTFIQTDGKHVNIDAIYNMVYPSHEGN